MCSLMPNYAISKIYSMPTYKSSFLQLFQLLESVFIFRFPAVTHKKNWLMIFETTFCRTPFGKRSIYENTSNDIFLFLKTGKLMKYENNESVTVFTYHFQ